MVFLGFELGSQILMPCQTYESCIGDKKSDKSIYSNDQEISFPSIETTSFNQIESHLNRGKWQENLMIKLGERDR